LEKNKISVFLGKSGCGKTTLLRLIAGLEEKSSGNIEIEQNEKIGFVFQEARLMPFLNVYNNIAFSQKESKKAKILELVKIIGLGGFENAYSNQLSGGMQARVAIARTLAYEPSIILMDEPFAALDSFTRENMQNKLLQIQSCHKKTILFVTHNIDEALILGHKIMLLQKGGIKEEYDLSNIKFPRDLLLDELILIKKNILKKIKET